MNDKYTAIYVDYWQSGSHQNSITRMMRIELLDGESVADCLVRLGIDHSTQYLFIGWPKLQGEDK